MSKTRTIYVDTSALLKRVVRDEAYTDALKDTLDGLVADGCLLCSSSLAWVEVERALRQRSARSMAMPGGSIIRLAEAALAGIGEVPFDKATIALASTIGDPLLRSLDAIHLASAIVCKADVMLTYDLRLSESATGAHLEVLRPS